MGNDDDSATSTPQPRHRRRRDDDDAVRAAARARLQSWVGCTRCRRHEGLNRVGDDLRGTAIDRFVPTQRSDRTTNQIDHLHRCAACGTYWLQQCWEVDTPDTRLEEFGLRFEEWSALSHQDHAEILHALATGDLLPHDHFRSLTERLQESPEPGGSQPMHHPTAGPAPTVRRREWWRLLTDEDPIIADTFIAPTPRQYSALDLPFPVRAAEAGDEDAALELGRRAAAAHTDVTAGPTAPDQTGGPLSDALLPEAVNQGAADGQTPVEGPRAQSPGGQSHKDVSQPQNPTEDDDPATT